MTKNIVTGALSNRASPIVTAFLKGSQTVMVIRRPLSDCCPMEV